MLPNLNVGMQIIHVLPRSVIAGLEEIYLTRTEAMRVRRSATDIGKPAVDLIVCALHVI